MNPMPDIPRQREGQSFAAHQEEVARWMGCTVAQMNRLHDETHRRLAEWTGVESRALKHARGKRLSDEEQALANLEETSVLHLQRYLVAATRVKEKTA
jgi:hypothetical protein